METFIYPPNRVVRLNNASIKGHHLTVYGNNNTIDGSNPNVHGDFNRITGSGAEVHGDNNSLTGTHAVVTGKFSLIEGSNAKVDGNSNTVRGDNAVVTGNFSVIEGSYAKVNGNDNRVTGAYAEVSGSGNNVTGYSATVRGNNNQVNGNPFISNENEVSDQQRHEATALHGRDILAGFVANGHAFALQQLGQQRREIQARQAARPAEMEARMARYAARTAEMDAALNARMAEINAHMAEMDAQAAAARARFAGVAAAILVPDRGVTTNNHGETGVAQVTFTLRGEDEELDAEDTENSPCLVCRTNKAVVAGICCGKLALCMACTRTMYEGERRGETKCVNCRGDVRHCVRIS